MAHKAHREGSTHNFSTGNPFNVLLPTERRMCITVNLCNIHDPSERRSKLDPGRRELPTNGAQNLTKVGSLETIRRNVEGSNGRTYPSGLNVFLMLASFK
jgi:hypothetical protein